MRLISKKEVYKKGGINLTENIFLCKNKEVVRVTLSLGKNSVLIIPRDSKGRFYLSKEKIIGTRKPILQFPSGGIEKGDDANSAAEKELSQELGLEGSTTFLGRMRPFYTLVDLEVNVFLCENVRELDKGEKLKNEPYEDIKRMILSEDKLYDLIKNGEIRGSYTLSALSMLKAYKVGLK